MSSSDPIYTWPAHLDKQNSPENFNRPMTTSRSHTVSSHYNNKTGSSQPRNSSDSEVSNLIPSYVDILTPTSGNDWLDAYEFPIMKQDKITHRRTFQPPIEKEPISIRKTRSMRDQTSTSKTRLRSPPPPPPPPQDNTPLNLLLSDQQLRVSNIDIKKQSIPFMNKVKRKLSFSKEKSDSRSFSTPPISPKKTLSTNIPSQQHHQTYTNSLAEYQGYSRQSRHRSFTYSPPPPRTSSLKSSSSILSTTSIPPVPPVPKKHASVLLKNRSTSIKKKKSDSSYSSTSSKSTNASQNQPLPMKAPSPEYTKNLSQDLAEIEQDIKALEIQRESFLLSNQQKTIGRKRGKTLPGSLATPPPIPILPLPPMKLNPIQMNIPEKKIIQRTLPPLQKSISTTPSTNRIKLSSLSTLDDSDLLLRNYKRKDGPGLGLGSGNPGTELNKSNLESPKIILKHSTSNTTNVKRKSHVPTTTKSSTTVRRTVSYRQPESNDENGRSPKSVYTALKYYGQYLSDYEKQIEIYDYSNIYFVGPHATKHSNILDPLNFGFDDERGDYKIVIKDHLAYRYEIMDLLGRGSFGQVVKCFDHKTSTIVALKLIRNKKRFHAQAITEVNILKKLIEWDPDDKYNLIQMTDHFYFRNHLCIAFECLSMNLYEFIKSNHFQGFSLTLIKKITVQILESLVLLAHHNIIHCDLKPENIMLQHPAKSSIKVIDFGSSCLESERVYTYIQSRFYRSPEVILGLSYHKAIDMWSVGCIAAELYTGLPLFPGENEQEQLGCIMEIMGLPDRHLIERCSRKKLFFDSASHPRIVVNSKGKRRLPGTRSLFQALKCHDIVFIDFIERCLQWDPSKRLTPKEAIQHDFILNINRNSITPPKPVNTFLSTAALSNNFYPKSHTMQRKSSIR